MAEISATDASKRFADLLERGHQIPAEVSADCSSPQTATPSTTSPPSGTE